jgi:hypothetical protein
VHELVDVMACLSAACVRACLGLARALHDGASLDDAVECEAAVLVDWRHDVCKADLARRGGDVDVLCLGQIELDASRADGHGFGRRVLGAVQCGCHGRSHIHGVGGVSGVVYVQAGVVGDS